MSTLICSVFPPKGGRLHSHTQRQTDSTVSCHSTFTHFALIQSLASIHFGNCCSTSHPSNWHFQSELEKCITLNHPKTQFWKTIWNLKAFASSSGHSVADGCFVKANQSAGFCLFIYPMKSLWYMESFWLGKQWGVIHIECNSQSSISHYQTTRLAMSVITYGNDVFRFTLCDCALLKLQNVVYSHKSPPKKSTIFTLFIGIQ